MRLSKLLRMIAATLSAIVTGLATLVTGRGEWHPVRLRPGDVAPDFSLAGSDGALYNLHEFRGRDAVVIAWFPKAFTAVCTRECASLGSSRGVLRGFKVRYFAASVDSIETNRRFAESLGVDYPILSDPGKSVARAYGVLRPTGLAHRWTFYIGKDGRILDIDRNVRASSHGADVAGALNTHGVPPTRS